MRSFLISVILFFPTVSMATQLTALPGSHGFVLEPGSSSVIRRDVHYWATYPQWGSNCKASNLYQLCIPIGSSISASSIIPKSSQHSSDSIRQIQVKLTHDPQSTNIAVVEEGPETNKLIRLTTAARREYRLEIWSHDAESNNNIRYRLSTGHCGFVNAHGGIMGKPDSFYMRIGSAVNADLLPCLITLESKNHSDLAIRLSLNSTGYRVYEGGYEHISAGAWRTRTSLIHDFFDITQKIETESIWNNVLKTTGTLFYPIIYFKGQMSFDIIDPQPSYNMTLLEGQQKALLNIKAKLNTNSDYVTLRLGNCYGSHDLCSLDKNGIRLPVHVFVSPASNPNNRPELRTNPPVRLDRGQNGFFKVNEDSLLNIDIELWRDDLNKLPPSDQFGEFTGPIALVLESSF